MVATYVLIKLENKLEGTLGRTYINQKLDTLQHGTNMTSSPPKNTVSYISVCLQRMTEGVKPNEKSPQDKASICG